MLRTFLLTANTSVSSTVNTHPFSSPTFISPFVISRQAPVDFLSPAWPSCSPGISIFHQWGLAVWHNIDQFNPESCICFLVTPYKKSICGYWTRGNGNWWLRKEGTMSRWWDWIQSKRVIVFTASSLVSRKLLRIGQLHKYQLGQKSYIFSMKNVNMSKSSIFLSKQSIRHHFDDHWSVWGCLPSWSVYWRIMSRSVCLNGDWWSEHQTFF